MARAGGPRATWRGLCFCRDMQTGRFLVFDLDEDLTARFGNADYAIRFARWLARGRSEELSVVVSDESRSGTIVWTEPQPRTVRINVSSPRQREGELIGTGDCGSTL